MFQLKTGAKGGLAGVPLPSYECVPGVDDCVGPWSHNSMTLEGKACFSPAVGTPDHQVAYLPSTQC